ncbi:hypothetical protein E8E13_006640 [Curvularia kusanoi]|uniref:Uncharacterized protein n=1 Tax=Curvularia kusanoi TaxID=90978 RepID=A0A9P4TB97_CURKU|nr:hypothetical protein E8E13_006640 [Curvularia kusanoi]
MDFHKQKNPKHPGKKRSGSRQSEAENPKSAQAEPKHIGLKRRKLKYNWPTRPKSRLEMEDQELAKAVERIDANHALTRALLFMVGQKVPDARRMILSSDVNLQRVRFDSMYNPDDFDPKLTTGEFLARAITRRESKLADAFDEADSSEIFDIMPKDQPNNHPIGADRPAQVRSSIAELRDNQIFNNNIFERAVQKAEKPGEIIIPASLDVQTITWPCERCGHNNPPVKENDENVPIGSIQGVFQNYECQKCGKMLLNEDEVSKVVANDEEKAAEKEAAEAEHPRAIPIPGMEASRRSMTDVLAGHRVNNPGQE